MAEGTERPGGGDTAVPVTVPVATQTLLVGFEGEGAGVEELSWGQREIWHVIEERKTWLPIGAVLALPRGTTLDDAVADLRFVMNRYPSMRTRIRRDPDRPRQVVCASGAIGLEIVDAADGEDPAEVAERVRQRYWTTDYDVSTEWPVRMAVVRHRGRLTHRVWVMCHLVTDGTGALVILDELADGDRPSGGTVAALAPLEQARWQRSAAGRRQNDAALRYWEKVLRTVSVHRFPERAGTDNPRYWQAQFDSPAMDLALRAVAARTRAEVSSILLTAFAVALVRVTGVNPVVTVLLVNNRFRPGLARTVSPIMHAGLCVIDVPDGTVDEAVARTRSRAIKAYKYAYYDPMRREELIARINRERGEEVDLECSINDSRLTPRRRAGGVPTAEEIRDALPRTDFRWLQKQDHRPYDKLYVTVDDVPDSLRFTVVTDTRHVPSGDVEAFIRGMEEVAVAAALDASTRTRVLAAVAR